MEILVVLAIISVLVALVMPAIGGAREAARRVQCQNNLKNISLAFIQFHDTYQRLPASGNFGHNPDGSGYRLHSWAVSILPFIEQGNLFDELDLDTTLTDPVNSAIKTAQVPLYVCPLDITRNKKKTGDLSYAVNGGIGFTHYYRGQVRDCPISRGGAAWDLNGDGNACSGDKALDDLDRKLFKHFGLFFLETWNTEITKRHYRLGDVRDGTSQTFMVTENVRTGFREGDDYGHFGDPTPQQSAFYIGPPCLGGSCLPGAVDYARCNSGSAAINSGLWTGEGSSPVPNSFHEGGVLMGYADGHVKFLSESVDGKVYAALASPQGLDLDSTELQQAIPSGTEY